MRSYKVNEIAKLLKVNEETVRRWIKSGDLRSTMMSKKKGNLVNELELYKFVGARPKYAKMLGCLESRSDNIYIEKLRDLLNDLIKKRDDLNDCINKIQTLLEEG